MNQLRCPRCGLPVRAGAKYCQHCRAPLSTPSAMKMCPQCHSPNRWDARFCAACRYEFTPSVGAERGLGRLLVPNTVIVAGLGASVLALLFCTLLVFIFQLKDETAATVARGGTTTPTSEHRQTATNTVSPTVSTTTLSPTDEGLSRAKRATVLIVVPIDFSSTFSTGTGSTITKRGHILTNYHLFVDDYGKPYNAKGEIMIWFPPRDNLKGEAEYHYRAILIEKDVQKDLALLRIIARKDGSALPADLELGVIPIGDSDKVDSPDPIIILGYPSVGKTTSLTISMDIVAGFLPAEGFIKTNAEINPGNSGGPVLNQAYEQIGVVSKVRVADASRGVPGKIGLIRPIKFAKPLIDLAKREAGE